MVDVQPERVMRMKRTLRPHRVDEKVVNLFLDLFHHPIYILVPVAKHRCQAEALAQLIGDYGDDASSVTYSAIDTLVFTDGSKSRRRISR